jgi:hypothetical protein
MEATKCLKPSDSGSRIGDRASVQAATRVNAEQASKRTMCRPTRASRAGARAAPGRSSGSPSLGGDPEKATRKPEDGSVAFLGDFAPVIGRRDAFWTLIGASLLSRARDTGRTAHCLRCAFSRSSSEISNAA